MTKTVMLFLVTALVLFIMLAVGVKLVFFPSAKDNYFAMSQASLLKVPSGMLVIRPTHFGKSMFRKGVIWASPRQNGGDNFRMMGRDVSLRDIMATAYGEIRGRVQLPPDAPTNNFDFLVTTSNPRQRFQKAIRTTLGYTADRETNDTDVLALKVVDPQLPGMTVSGPDEKTDYTVNHGQMHITHLQLKELVPGFEQILQTPVMDETSLTNYYDFSLAFSSSLMAKLGNQSTARPAMDKILSNWGLALQPDTAPMEMLVVKKVY